MRGLDGGPHESSAETQDAEWVAELAARVQSGEPVDLSALALEHPVRVAMLRHLLPAIEAMADLGRSSDCPARPDGPHALGPRRLGEYEVVRELGRGGMGIVYEATQVSLRRSVALKVLPAAAALDPRQFERFQIEARAAGCLQHPNIVPVYGVGRDGAIAYYAMRLVEGRSLAEVIRELRRVAGLHPPDGDASTARPHSASTAVDPAFGGPPVSPRRPSASGLDGLPMQSTEAGDPNRVRDLALLTARLGLQAAEALDHAHANGVVHRDVKPANLLVDAQGHLWVTDFGLARVIGDATLTQSGDLLGTLRYMSPEQALGRRVVIDGRSDVYSLGVTLYELLTLRPAVGGVDRAEILRRLAHDEPAAPRTITPGVPRDLETIVLKAMAKDLSERYATARDLADELRRFLDGRPIVARRPSLVDRSVKLARRNRAAVGAAALFLASLASAGAGALAWSNNLLRRHNEQLEFEKRRADTFAGEAETHRVVAERQRDLAESQRLLSDRFFYGARVRQAFDALRARQFEAAQEILATQRPGRGQDDPREFTWHYLWMKSRADLVVLSGESERNLVFQESRSGASIAVGDRSGVVRLRDTASGDLLKTFTGHQYQIEALAFSPDGSLLASASLRKEPSYSSELFLWDTWTGALVARLPGFERRGVFQLCFDPSGRYLWEGHEEAGLPGRFQCVWDLGEPGKRRGPRRVNQFEIWPNSKNTASGPRILAARPGSIPGLFDALSRTLLRSFPLGPTTYDAVVLSADGRRAAAHENLARRITVWARRIGRALDQFETAAPGAFPNLQFSADSRFLAWCDDRGALQVRNISKHATVKLTSDPREEAYPERTSFALSPDSRRIAWCYTGATRGLRPVTISDMATGATLATYPGRVERVGQLAFHPDNRSLLTLGKSRVVRWNLDPPAEPPSPAGHVDEAWSVAFSPDGKTLATGSDDSDEPMTLKLWDPESGHLKQAWKPHSATVSTLAFSPDGKTLATGCLLDSGNLRLWDVDTGALRAELAGHTDKVRSVAFSPDGRLLASGSKDCTIKVWYTSPVKLRRTLPGHEDSVRQVAFHRDGRILASVGNDMTLRLWDVRTGRHGRVWRSHVPLAAVAFAPDGRTLAVADNDGVVTIQDVVSGEVLRSFHGDDRELLCLAYSPDGRTLAAGGMGRLVHLWDPATGQELATLDDLSTQVNALVFSPDGSQLAACAHDGSVRLHRGR